MMQGTPDAPRCGFTSRTVAALRKTGTPFGYFDILSDEAVRQAAKVTCFGRTSICILAVRIGT